MLVSLMTWKGKCKRPNVQSNPAVKIFGNAHDRTSARTSNPSSVNESKSFPYACKNSDENALTGPLYKGITGKRAGKDSEHRAGDAHTNCHSVTTSTKVLRFLKFNTMYVPFIYYF